MDGLKNWFAGLEQREQMLVGFGSVFVVIFLGYFLILEPAFNVVDERQERVERMRTDLSLLQQVAAQPKTTPQGNAPQGRSMVVVVEQTVQAAGLKSSLTRNQPQDANVIRVTLQNAPFENVVRWLADLGARHRMFIQSATINSAKQPGTVIANVTLSRS